MKNFFLFGIAAFAAVCLSSCSKDDDNEEPNNPEKEEIEVYSIDANNAVKEGSNKVVMINNKGGLSYWSHPLGTSTRSNDTIVLPFTGVYTITFEENTINGIVKTPKTVTVTTLDTPVDAMWELLAGTNGAGKTWVWAKGLEYDGIEDVCWGGGEFRDEFWEAGYEPQSIPSNANHEFWEEYFDFWDYENAKNLFEWIEADQNEMTFSFGESAKFVLVDGNGEKTEDVYTLNTKAKTISTVAETPFLWSPWSPWTDGETTDEDFRDWYDLADVSKITTYEILLLTNTDLVLSFEVNDKRFLWLFNKK